MCVVCSCLASHCSRGIQQWCGCCGKSPAASQDGDFGQRPVRLCSVYLTQLNWQRLRGDVCNCWAACCLSMQGFYLCVHCLVQAEVQYFSALTGFQVVLCFLC